MTEKEPKQKEVSDHEEKEIENLESGDGEADDASELGDEELDEVSGGIIIIGGIHKSGKGS